MGFDSIDTSETEELAFDSKMSVGNMESMAEQIEKLNRALVEKDLAYQSFVAATSDTVSKDTFDNILNTAFAYQHDYMNRYTTEEMAETLEKVGFAGVGVVVIDANWAEDAVWNSREVFALKDGKMEIIENPGKATEYEKNGYVLAVTPYTYEVEFFNDLQNFIEE